MSRTMIRSLWVVVLAVALCAGVVNPVMSARAETVRTLAADPPQGQRPMPPDPYRPWDGVNGVPKPDVDELSWSLITAWAELDEEPEVRAGAQAAIAAGAAAIREFIDHGYDEVMRRVNERKRETAAKNRAEIEKLRGTGGHWFNKAVEEALNGTDGDRERFLAYRGEIERQRDREETANREELRKHRRAIAEFLTKSAGPAVRAAAQKALADGDEALAEFFKSGFAAAEKADAEKREKDKKEEDKKDKDNYAQSDLARKAILAAEAWKRLEAAHHDGVRALQRSANALTSANLAAREAAKILAAHDAAGSHPPGAFDHVKTEVSRQHGYTVSAAEQARVGAATAKVHVDELTRLGMTYGQSWLKVAEGMAHAAVAAERAGATAVEAVTATEATDQAKNAQDKAEKALAEATKWERHAREHAAAAAEVAAAAAEQAEVAKKSAEASRIARDTAVAEAQRAIDAAKTARDERVKAENEAKSAREQRVIAEKARDEAATHRRDAQAKETQARIARNQADTEKRNTQAFRDEAARQTATAHKAATNAANQENAARVARDEARARERDAQATEARAQALEAAAKAAEAHGSAQAAAQAAREARTAATNARQSADRARGAADRAAGAAAQARASALEAERAAARARAAADKAAAHARNADAHASRAESAAAEAHKAARESEHAAAEATAKEIRAAEAAREAARLADLAAHHAIESLRAADRTKQAADNATREAVNAATQASVAIRAANTAATSAQAIIDPANNAKQVAIEFRGEDFDTSLIDLVSKQAGLVGKEQADHAAAVAKQAEAAARAAEEAAKAAVGKVKPAYEAAAAAARSSAQAAGSAAEAQRHAADAAQYGREAREAAAKAVGSDQAAAADAAKARSAADQANNDAAIAGRSADAAEKDAQAARTAATRATEHAAAAKTAAEHAATLATEAENLAKQAEQHATDAAKAAENALAHSIEAQKAADRAEEEARRVLAEKRKNDAALGPESGLEPDEEKKFLSSMSQAAADEYRRLVADAQKDFLGFILEVGGEAILEFIGWEDAKKCFTQGNFEACLWTMLNVGSLASSFMKFPAVAKAVKAIVDGVDAYLKISSRSKDLLKRLKKGLRLKDCLKSLPSVRDDFPCKVVPLGRGSTQQGGGPRNFMERMAMDEAMTYPKDGKVLKDVKMIDKRWHHDDGWVKMEMEIEGVIIHYNRNNSMDAWDDFKVKRPWEERAGSIIHRIVIKEELNVTRQSYGRGSSSVSAGI